MPSVSASIRPLPGSPESAIAHVLCRLAREAPALAPSGLFGGPPAPHARRRRVVAQPLRALLEPVARPERPLVALPEQWIVPELVQLLRHLPAVRTVGDPALRRDHAEIEEPRVPAQRLLPATVRVLVEVAHRELAQAAVDRVAVAERQVVRLRDRAPAPVAAEDCDDVVVVAHRLQIEEQRPL